jgi:hypothetical protein
MSRSLPLAVASSLVASSLVACSPGGTYQGHLVDGLSGEVRADVRMLARSPTASDMACQVREATSDASGNFLFENLCSGSDYTISSADETLMLTETPSVTGGVVSTAAIDMTIWRAPTGKGMYRLSKDALAPVRVFADVATETVKDGELVVRYPTLKPTRVSTLEKSDWLVIAGKDLVDRLEIHPLVADDAVRGFANEVTIDSHVYIGVKFNSDTEFEILTTQLDASKVRNVTNGDQVVRFIAQDAVPEGRYAIVGPTDKRTFVLDFGQVKGAATAKNGE